ncbi:MAG: hypothetical protein H6Q15_1557 [Bacteroidetes bacterium]|nr:hypothetical protein [Bacteroidota bacterium]
MQLNMKKILIAVLATISCLAAIGQSGQRPLYFDDYLFPRYMASGCYDTNDLSINRVSYFWNCSSFPTNETIIAQPFFIDSSISIKGIGAFVIKPNYTGPIYDDNFRYLQIRDSSLNNVLAQIRYDTLIPKSYIFVNQPSSSFNNRYIEALFDSAITVTGRVFYVTITFSTVNKLCDGYNLSFGSVFRNLYECNDRDDFPILIGGEQGGWKPILQSLINNTNDPKFLDSTSVPYEMNVFPILKRSLSSLDDVDIDNRIEVYPNPSSKEINITSQCIINSIDILNSLGQRVYREKINTTNKTIDISTLNKGLYIIELKTEKGIVNRKFIKE